MSSVESFIVITALVGSIGGGIILLSSLAGKRAQWVRAFNLQQKLHAHEELMDMNESSEKNPYMDDDIDLTPPQ